MTDRWRHHAPTIIIATLTAAAVIVTGMLFAGLWSGLSDSSRVQVVLLRLEPEEQITSGDQVEDQSAAEGTPPAGDNPVVESKAQDNTSAKVDPAARAVARIMEQNLFVTPSKPGFRGIIGVLGDRVLYPGGVSVGVGESHNGATIKATGSNWVKFEHEGEIVSVGVFGGNPPEEPQPQADKESKTEPGNEKDDRETTPSESGLDKPKTDPEQTTTIPTAASQPSASQPATK